MSKLNAEDNNLKNSVESTVLSEKQNLVINLSLSILSGVLLALSFPHPSIRVFSWIAFIPFLFLLSRSSYRGTRNFFIYGLLFGFTFYAIALYWIQVFGYLAWFSLSIVLSLWTAVFAVGAYWIQGNAGMLGRLIMIPVLWSILEYGRASGPWGFGWVNIGSTVENMYVASIASYIGEIGLSGAVVFCNVLLYESLRMIIKIKIEGSSLRLDRLKMFGSAILVIALFCLALLSATSSNLSIQSRNDKALADSIQVAIVQPNIPQYLKIDNTQNEKIKTVYRELTKEALFGRNDYETDIDALDIIVWPESVLIAYADDEKKFYNEITSIVTSENTAFLYGTLSRDNKNVIHNNAVFSDVNRNMKSYQKIHLVPFGEYVPIRRLVERVNGMAKLVIDKTPGTNFAVFDFNNAYNDNPKSDSKSGQKRVTHGKFSSIICFESADSALVGKMVRKGARMVFVLTNDGWFGNSAALWQHYRISRMRAIEYGVPVIQAANTGVSGFIDKHGQSVLNTSTNRRTIIRSRVSFSRNPSKYASIGPWIPFLFCSILIIAAGFTIRGRRSAGIKAVANII